MYLLLVISLCLTFLGVRGEKKTPFVILQRSAGLLMTVADITLHSCSLYRPGVLAKVLTKQFFK